MKEEFKLQFGEENPGSGREKGEQADIETVLMVFFMLLVSLLG